MRIEKHIIKNQCIIDDLEFELNLIIILRILKKRYTPIKNTIAQLILNLELTFNRWTNTLVIHCEKNKFIMFSYCIN